MIADKQHSIDLSSEAGKKRWLDLRKGLVTASDISAVCGWHPTRTPLQVYLEKTGASAGEAETPIMRRGRWLENAVLAAVQEIRPQWRVIKAATFYESTELRIGATPDAFAVDENDRNGVLEFKAVAFPEFEKKWCADGSVVAPLHHMAQVLTAMYLTGAVWGAVVALAIDAYRDRVEIVPVEPHRDAWNLMTWQVEKFWRDTDAGIPPEINPDLDRDAVSALYPRATKNSVDLSHDNRLVALLHEHDDLRGRIAEAAAETKPLHERLEAVKTEIKAKMCSASEAKAGPFRISWNNQHRKAIPETEFRVLRIKRLGGSDDE